LTMDHFLRTTFPMPAFFAAALSVGCAGQPFEESAMAFSMSDTMMARCAFVEATAQEVKNEIRFFGKIEADNNKTAQVFSAVGGFVKSINAGLGDYVKQGEVLATIQSSEVADYEQQRLDAINEVAIAEKNLQVANDLFEGKLNSEKDVKLAEAELEKARSNLARIREIYDIYKFRSGSIFPLTAPISGFVVGKKININELIRQDGDEPLFSIANTSEIWAVAYVNESNIAHIRESYEAVVSTIAFPDSDYRGRIDKIYNVIDASTKSMKFRVNLPNSDFKLKPDMNCTVSVSYGENRSMVSVPSSAIIFDKSKYWVMVFKDRHNIETRPVEVYRQLNDVTYLLSGLAEGETVITKNRLLIYDALNE